MNLPFHSVVVEQAPWWKTASMRPSAPASMRRQEIVLVEIVGDPEIGEIGDLVAVGEVVDDEDVVMTFGVERGDDVGTDHAGAARDDDHEGLWLLADSGPYKGGQPGCR